MFFCEWWNDTDGVASSLRIWDSESRAQVEREFRLHYAMRSITQPSRERRNAKLPLSGARQAPFVVIDQV